MRSFKVILATALIIVFANKSNGQEANEKLTRIDEFLEFDGKLVAAVIKHGFYFSADTGKTWQLNNDGLPAGLPYSYSRTVCGNNLLAVVKEQVYKLTAGQSKWMLSSSGLEGLLVTDLCTFKGKAYAGSTKGLYSSDDFGSTWKKVKKSGDMHVNTLLANEDQLIVTMYKDEKDRDALVHYTTSDGEKWKSVSTSDFKSYGRIDVEKKGSFITGTWCRSSLYDSNNKLTCYVNKYWVLNESGTKWEEMELEARYFWFAENLVYAIIAYPERKGKNGKFYFDLRILESDNRGRSWTDVTEHKQKLMDMQNALSDKIRELEAGAAAELARYEADMANAERYHNEVKQKLAMMKSATGGNPLKYSSPPPIYDGSRYRDLSNDRFKARHNQRDAFIDSQGALHLPKK